jgi:hypothetical protein
LKITMPTLSFNRDSPLMLALSYGGNPTLPRRPRPRSGPLARPSSTIRNRLARVNCAAGALRFSPGQADVAALIDAASSTVVGQGRLDLDAHTIDVRLTPSPKGVHPQISASGWT